MALAVVSDEPTATMGPTGSTDLDLRPYSDGREWDEEGVKREILHHLEGMVLHGYEVGRRLIWAKHLLGNGRFADWMTENFPLSDSTAKRYMRVASVLTKHRSLLKPAAGATLKKMLLITSIPEDQLQEMVEAGSIADVPLEELGEVPYLELRKKVKKYEEERVGWEDAVSSLEGKLEGAKKLLGEQALLDGELSEDEGEAVAQIDSSWADFEKGARRLHFTAQRMARAWGDLSPDVKAHVQSRMAAATAWVEHMELAVREVTHGDVQPYQLQEAARGAAQAGAPIPDAMLSATIPFSPKKKT